MSASSRQIRQHLPTFRASGHAHLPTYLQQELGWNADEAAAAVAQAGLDASGNVLPETLATCEAQLGIGVPVMASEALQTCTLADDSAQQQRFRELAGQTGQPWYGMSSEEEAEVLGQAVFEPIEGPSIGVDRGGVEVDEDPLGTFSRGLSVMQGAFGLGAAAYVGSSAAGVNSDDALKIAEIANAAGNIVGAAGRGNARTPNGGGATGTGPVGGRPPMPQRRP